MDQDAHRYIAACEGWVTCKFSTILVMAAATNHSPVTLILARYRSDKAQSLAVLDVKVGLPGSKKKKKKISRIFH